MNRNYKVVWNQALGCFTAVAEYAKSSGKSSHSSVNSNTSTHITSNRSPKGLWRLSTLGIGLLAAGFSMQINAANCVGSTTVECGIYATASPKHGIAIGKNATSVGSQSVAIGGGSSGQNTTALGQQSIAIGANVVSKGHSSIAIGGDDLDVASKSNIDGSTNSNTLNGGTVNSVFKYFTNRDLVDPTDNYTQYTESGGAASVAIGVKSHSEGALSTAIGTHANSSGIASSAFGVGASATKKGSVALGAGSLTDEDVTSEKTMNIGLTTYVVAGNVLDADGSIKTGAQVSVGSKGFERQIKNVAGGRVAGDSTDAVNGSQLNAINQEINKGIKFNVNDASSGGTIKKTFALGEEIKFDTDSNLTTTALSTGDGIKLALANVVNIGTANPVNINGTAGTVSGLTNRTFDANEVYTDGQAATQEQLRGLNTGLVTKGFGLKAADGNTVQKDLGQAVEVVGSNSNITTKVAGGKIAIALNNDLDLGANGSVTMGSSFPIGLGPVTTVDRLGVRTGNALVNTIVSGVGVTVTTTNPFNPLNPSSATLSSNGLNILNGPSVTKSGIDAGNRRITRVSNGIAPTDAVNLSQLTGSSAAARTEVVAGTNVADVVKSTGTNGQDIYTVNANGSKTSAGSLAVEVTSTTDANNLTDYAVDLSQGTKDSLGKADSAMQNVITQIDGVTVKTLDKDDNTANFITGDNIALTADSSGIKVALKNQLNLTNAGSIEVGKTFIDKDGVTIGLGNNPVILTNQGLVITNGASITKDGGVNAGGKKVTNVKAGKADTDAVNVSQLNASSDAVIDLGFNISAAGGADDNVKLGETVDFTNTDGNLVVSNTVDNGINYNLADDITVDSLTAGNTMVDNNGISIVSGSMGNGNPIRLTKDGLFNGGNTIKGVGDGRVDATSNQAINGSQLFSTTTSIKNAIGGETVVNGDGTITTANIGDTGQDNIHEALKSVRQAATDARTTVSAGNSNITVTSTGPADGPTNYEVTIADNLDIVSVKTGNTVTNNDGVKVDDGAGNSSTMTTAGTTVTNVAGNTSSYGANGFTASDNAGNSTIVDQSGVSFTNSAGATGPSITAGGINAGTTQITNVTSGGTTVTNAANIGDVQAAAAGAKTEVVAGTNVTSVTKTTGSNGQNVYTVNANGTTASAGSNAVTVTKGIKDANNVTDFAIDLSTATKTTLTQVGINKTEITKGINFGNGTTANNYALGDTIKVTGDSNITSTTTAGGVQVALNNNIDLGDQGSVTTGNTTTNNGGVTITGGPNQNVALTNQGLNNGGNRVTGVAAGIDATDAVNVGQLNGFGTNINSSINDLGYRIDDVEDDANAGISAAMAMSSIPQSFLPGKSMVGGGIATYNGESAVAIGVSRVSDNGRWVLKVNGTADTQGNAGGAVGAGFHF